MKNQRLLSPGVQDVGGLARLQQQHHVAKGRKLRRSPSEQAMLLQEQHVLHCTPQVLVRQADISKLDHKIRFMQRRDGSFPCWQPVRLASCSAWSARGEVKLHQLFAVVGRCSR